MGCTGGVSLSSASGALEPGPRLSGIHRLDVLLTRAAGARRRIKAVAGLALVVSLLACGVAGRATAPSIPPAGQSGELAAGTYTRSISVGGRERSYLIRVPERLAEDGPAPVVLVFHGGGGNAQSAVEMSNYDVASEAYGYVAVYPNGTGRLENLLLTWNAGTCCGYAMGMGVDDVEFVRALIEDVVVLTPIDRHRIYATGMSNSALMSYRLACELADEIAAIAPISGTQNVEPCLPGRPLSVIHFHGTADADAPYDGGVGDKSISRVDFVSVQQTIDFWLEFDGRPRTPIRERSGEIIHDRYGPCDQGTAVELYTIVGGGRAYPGGNKPRGLADTPTQDISATRLSWEFFTAHPMP
jgi:polyhydroxybutyrate depolymerase